jgi:N-methylhydantoinase A
MTAHYRLGVDIGGTFTDAILWDEASGTARIAKVPSTPSDPSVGFLRVARKILGQAGVGPGQVPVIVHGTTVATNAIIEGKTVKTALVTTRGFRDVLEIGRQNRPSLYDLQFEKPRPLVPRDRCFEVPERLDARGRVIEPLDCEAVGRVIAELAREGVASVAVCFLHSYINPDHEHRAGELLRAGLPGVSVSLSADVAPEFREYFRASTTVVNAAIRPVVEQYLERIERSLSADGFAAVLLVMQSNGGVMTAASAVERPVFMVESGPAAGVIASTHLADTLGLRDVISFDMGGTTAKAGLVRDGVPTITKDYEVGTTATAGTGAARGSGYPIRTPVIDLVEIGAGGGSIAWVDSGGILRVGPRSAGADPGPVCYGLGGTEPTITDANLVLGRINPDYFLGGEVRLDVGAARWAIEERCARSLGLDVIAAANGIVEIANAAMTNAIHLISVQRGYDPREFALIAFGGAGPLHANRLAAELRIPTTVIPPSPGITSAMGLLATDLTHEYSRTMRQPTEALDADALEAAFAAMESEGRGVLAREGVAAERMTFRRFLEMRYVGQSHELSIGVAPGELLDGRLRATLDQFHREHERAYGFCAPAEPSEVVNIRITAIGEMPRPAFREAGSGRDAPSAVKGSRRVHFAELLSDETDGFVDCRIYDRYRLTSGAEVRGPAIVEELDSTTVIHPGFGATVDRFGNLLVRAMEGSNGSVEQAAAPARPRAVRG